MVVKSSESEFLRDIAFFSNLPEEDMNSFLKAVRIHDYRKNDYVYHQSDTADRFFIVMSGWVRLYRETLDGDEPVSILLGRGKIFGEGAMFYQSNSYIFSAQAAEQSRLFEISQTVLRYRAGENPEIMKRIMASMCDKMIRIQTENEHLAHMSTAQRAACLLLRLSSHMVGNGGTFTFPYDKSLAAAQLGMKRETFSRALMHLREQGVSVNGSEIRIESFPQLCKFSCDHCALSNGECDGARETYHRVSHDTWKIPVTHSHSSHGA